MKIKTILIVLAMGCFGMNAVAQDLMNTEKVTVLKGIAIDADTAAVHQDTT